MLVSIDLETSGLDPRRHQILEVAAVAMPPNDPTNMWSFHRTVKWTEITGQPVALAMNAGLIDQMSKLEYQDWTAVSNDFTNWLTEIHEIADPFGKIVPVGFNVGKFDMAFLSANMVIPQFFSHRCLEIGSLYATIEGPAKSSDFLHLGEKYGVEGEAHNALFDAHIAAYAVLEKFNVL